MNSINDHSNKNKLLRFCEVCSTLLLSIVIAAIIFPLSVILCLNIVWPDGNKLNQDLCYYYASVPSLLAFISCLITRWNSKGSRQLHKIEILVGVLIVIGGATFAYHNHILSVNHVPTGPFSGLEFVFYLILGIYFSFCGLVLAIAGGFGLVSLKISDQSSD